MINEDVLQDHLQYMPWWTCFTTGTYGTYMLKIWISVMYSFWTILRPLILLTTTSCSTSYKCMEFLIFYSDDYDHFHLTEDNMSEMGKVFLNSCTSLAKSHKLFVLAHWVFLYCSILSILEVSYTYTSTWMNQPSQRKL